MPALPSVNFLVVLVAAAASFVSGAVYWGIIAKPLTKLLGEESEPIKMPPVALIAGFLTRVVVAYVLAIFLSYAGVRSALAGVAIAWLACVGFVIPIGIGQAASRQRSWTSLVVGMGEVLLGYAWMGAIIGAWAGQGT